MMIWVLHSSFRALFSNHFRPDFNNRFVRKRKNDYANAKPVLYVARKRIELWSSWPGRVLLKVQEQHCNSHCRLWRVSDKNTWPSKLNEWENWRFPDTHMKTVVGNECHWKHVRILFPAFAVTDSFRWNISSTEKSQMNIIIKFIIHISFFRTITNNHSRPSHTVTAVKSCRIYKMSITDISKYLLTTKILCIDYPTCLLLYGIWANKEETVPYIF